MSLKASIKKNRLCQRIEEEGYKSVLPCDRCVRLHKICFRSESSDRYSECVRAGNSKCAMSKPTFSDAEQRRLMKARQVLQEEEEAALAKLLRLKKQSRLLESRAGDFITRDYKEIAELEELERREKEELKRIERERLESNQKERDTESARAATSVS